MSTIRNLVLAGTFAIGAAFASGTANAAPALDLNVPVATESGVTQAYYPGGYYGYNRLCYVPFYRLVRIFGYWQARAIKSRCFYRPYY